MYSPTYIETVVKPPSYLAVLKTAFKKRLSVKCTDVSSFNRADPSAPADPALSCFQPLYRARLPARPVARWRAWRRRSDETRKKHPTTSHGHNVRRFLQQSHLLALSSKSLSPSCAPDLGDIATFFFQKNISIRYRNVPYDDAILRGLAMT